MAQNPTKRLHYFDHQFLRAADFTDEQEYHLGRRRLHNRALHTWGIAEGLDVSFDTGSAAVTVQQGTAVDSDGNEIVLTEDRRVDLSAQPAGAAVYVTIEYRETQTDLSKETDIQDNTRWTEDPDIKALADRPAQPSRQIILGKVNRSGTVVSDIDRSDRRAAGAVSGDITTSALTLKRERVDPATWPRLTCSGSNQAALENGSLKIDANREIFFADNGQIRSLDDKHRLVFNRGESALDLIESGRIRLFTGATPAERLTVSAEGFVGIGQPAPKARLTFANTTGDKISLWGDGSGPHYGFGIQNSLLQIHTDTVGADIAFGFGTSAALTETVRFKGDGNVGIGRGAKVGAKLDVNGTVWAAAMQITDAAGTPYPDNGVWMANNIEGTTKWLHIGGITDAGARRLALLADRIFASGNVGIGAANPGAKLSVIGGADTAVQIGDRAKSGSVGLQFLGSGYKHAALRFDGDNLIVEDASMTAKPSTWFADQAMNFVVRNGSLGVGTTTPSHALHVNSVLGIRQNRTYLTGGGGNNSKWSSISFNAYHDSGNSTWLFPDDSVPAVTLEMDAADNNPRFEVWSTNSNNNKEFGQRLGVYRDKVVVRGNLEIFGKMTVGGGKQGYVVDQFVNNLGETLELGDVVVVGRNQSTLYYGADNDIPIPEVDLTDTAHDTRVCGIVCEVYGKLHSDEAAAPAGQKGRGAKKAAGKAEPPPPTQAVPLSAEELETLDRRKVQPGQTGLIVTLGAFAHCKVDADIAPIEAGDLLTTSPTRGHAQRVTDRALSAGAILGKALGGLKGGKGVIPVMVAFQ